MNQWQETVNKLRDSFLQMPLPTRVIGVAMVAVIAIGLWMLSASIGSEDSLERLFGGEVLTDDEITKIQAALSAAELRDWQVEHNRISVPSQYKDRYIRAISEADALPLHTRTFVDDVQKSTGPWELNSHRLDRQAHAKERDLGRRIAEFPSVLRASVEHSVLDKGFAGNHRQSASVVVNPVGSDPLPPHMIRKIKEMVRASYAGMEADDVVVTDVNAHGVGEEDSDSPLFQARVRWEQFYFRKAHQVLAGFGPLSIDATVEIDPTMDSETASLQYDAQPTTLQEQSAQLSIESSRPLPGGVPGVASNAYGNRPAAIDPAPPQTSKTTQRNEALKKVAGEQYEISRTASLQPKRLSFSVGVPESYYEKIWRDDFFRSNPEASAADLKPMTPEDRGRLKLATVEEIKTALSPMLLSVSAGEDPFPLIEVWDHRDLPEPAVEAPTTAAQTLTWLANSWQTLALFGLGVLALLVARGVAKAGPGLPRPDFEEGFGLEIPKPAPAEENPLPVDMPPSPRLTVTGQHLKDELSQVVGANPEAAASVLRSWLDASAA
ncbi:beta-cystathionase [Candidatus Laterigemmans baculatus]|uniref:beta-cystathionase n=1 Tax=Candidatus Laterigemmans baculatus TaxID=2770505 RepID=UPI0013DBA58F|nr:beta-cystathionase [Candidatus Laterigemmans baculatus]